MLRKARTHRRLQAWLRRARGAAPVGDSSRRGSATTRKRRQSGGGGWKWKGRLNEITCHALLTMQVLLPQRGRPQVGAPYKFVRVQVLGGERRRQSRQGAVVEAAQRRCRPLVSITGDLVRQRQLVQRARTERAHGCRGDGIRIGRTQNDRRQVLDGGETCKLGPRLGSKGTSGWLPTGVPTNLHVDVFGEVCLRACTARSPSA